MILRYATINDLPAIMDLSYAMHQTGRYREIPYVAHKMASVWVNGFNRPDSFSAIVADVDGKLVGIVAGEVLEYMFGTEKLLNDLGLFVQPEFRRGSLAVQLIKAFKEEGKRLGVREVVMGSTTLDDPEALNKLYEHAEFVRVGSIYKWGVV